MEECGIVSDATKPQWKSHAKLNIGSVEDEEQPHVLLWLIIHFLKGNFFFFNSTQYQLQSSFINWKPEIILDPRVRMFHCLISLTVSLDAVTYIPKRITSDSFQKVCSIFGRISNSFRSVMLQKLQLFSGGANDDDAMFLVLYNFVSSTDTFGQWQWWLEVDETFSLVELIVAYRFSLSNQVSLVWNTLIENHNLWNVNGWQIKVRCSFGLTFKKLTCPVICVCSVPSVELTQLGKSIPRSTEAAVMASGPPRPY